MIENNILGVSNLHSLLALPKKIQLSTDLSTQKLHMIE